MGQRSYRAGPTWLTVSLCLDLPGSRRPLRTGPGAPLPSAQAAGLPVFLVLTSGGLDRDCVWLGLLPCFQNLVTCFFFSLKKVKKEKRR